VAYGDRVGLFTDDPTLLIPALEPRFGVQRCISDRGGVYDRRIKDLLMTPAPSVLVLDSLKATLIAIDPLLLALIVAGYDPREIVIGTSSFGNTAYQAQGYVRASLRSGIGYGLAGNWSTTFHITDPGTFHNIVAIRVLAWRQAIDPAVVPVDLDGLAGYERYRDPADQDGTDRDGWLLLGLADPLLTSQMAGRAMPPVLVALVDRIVAGMVAGNEPGLVRIFNPANWVVPREREARCPTLLEAALIIWADQLSHPAAFAAFLGVDAGGVAAIDQPAHQLRSVLNGVMSSGVQALLAEVSDELEQRRRMLEPFESSLPTVLSRLATTHWALALIQLHEYGLIDIVPLPAPTPAAIPVLDLTGFYQSTPDAAGDFIASMQINQAGSQIAGFWVDSQLQVWPIEGFFDPAALVDDTFRFSLVSTADDALGSLYLSPPPTRDPTALGVYVRWSDGLPWVMVRQDRKGRIPPEDLVARMDQTANPASLEPLLHPLHQSLRDRMVLVGYELVAKIGVISDVILTGASEPVLAMNNSIVNDVITKKLAFLDDDGKFILMPLLVRLRVEWRNFLAARPVPEAAGINAWFQLRSIVTLYREESKDIAALLGISPGGTHNYEYTLRGAGAEVEGGVGFSLGVGAFMIGTEFTHKSACVSPDVDHDWMDHYVGALYLGCASAGPEGGADLVYAFYDTGTNDLNTDDEWTRDDFLCFFVVGELSGGGGLFAGGLGAEGGREFEGYTFFRGRDGASASGVGDGGFVALGVGLKGGWGGTLSGMWGYYTRRDGGSSTGPPPPPQSQTVVVYGADTEVQYFGVDSDVLTADAKQVLLDFVLSYRPLLDDAGSYLILEGDASRTGSTEHNLDLSRRRILSVYDYLNSLMTSPPIGSLRASSALAVRDSHILFSPRGEARPAFAKLPDDIENADWRRTTLVVSGRQVETFHAAGVLVSPEDQP
jgi:outer membrane protein OmpA-like peptidoglycan-associated protein